MNILQAVVLGILQGATEFLPVSSSAHLVLVPWLFNWPANSVFFDASLHLGTLLAVLIYFWRDLWALIVAWVGTLQQRRIDSAEGRLAWLIILATIPAGLAGVLLEDWFGSVFGKPVWVAVLLLVTGVLLFASERQKHGDKRAEDLKTGDALIIGCAQAVAVLPGISRSGATMCTGLWRGLNRSQAARFSFLLSVPIVAAAGFFSLLKVFESGDTTGIIAAVVGAVAAAVSGYLVISGLLRYLRQHSLNVFAYYCWAFGGLCLLLALLRG